MPSIVYCDNRDCIFHDDCRECDVDKLVIERGVCTGSPRHGRNVSENDLDERLKAENAKLRELAQDYDKVLSSMHALCDCDFVPLNDAVLLGLRSRMYELGIEVE